MGKKYSFNDDELEEMKKMYVSELKSLGEIAKKYNVDKSVIKKRLDDMGVKIPKKSAYSIDYWIERGLSKDEAVEKVKKFKPCMVEYWIGKGLSDQDAKLKVELHLMNTKRAFIIKYGDELGLKLYKEKKIKEGQNSPRRVEYWIERGYSPIDAEKKVSETQNKFSLKICIEKYGEEEGKKIFNDRQNRWQETLISNGNLKKGHSKISQELFYTLLNYYNLDYRKNIKFWSHNGEFKVNKPEGGIFLYDFVDENNKKIIEYNGDMYHANPKKYNENDTPNPFRKKTKAIEIWEHDRKKLNEVKKLGYETLVIWDSEYRWGSKEKVIKKCLKFLNLKDEKQKKDKNW